ncbi:hypothetical protein PCANB_000180 [Pneumocystis canis]|nr:hypothetical protein PCK1_000174 [Pneumocystis canis]KAG5439898.1 hypothetical protein PCANB_000180 [Pneumocystis canis]
MSCSPGDVARLVIKRGFPCDISAREFAALFFFAEGCMSTSLQPVIIQSGVHQTTEINNEERTNMTQSGGNTVQQMIGIVKFNSITTARAAKAALQGKLWPMITLGETFDIELQTNEINQTGIIRSPLEPPIIVSPTPSSNGSLQSLPSAPLHPQTSRFAQYCGATPDLKTSSSDWMHTFSNTYNNNVNETLTLESTANVWPTSPGCSYNSFGILSSAQTMSQGSSTGSAGGTTLTGDNTDEWRFQLIPSLNTIGSMNTINTVNSLDTTDPTVDVESSTTQRSTRFGNSLAVNVPNVSSNGSSYANSGGMSPGRHKSTVQNYRLMHYTPLPSITSPSNGQSLLTSPQAAHFVPSSPNGFVMSPKIQPLLSGVNGLHLANSSGHPYYVNSSCGYGLGNHMRGAISFSTNPADQNPPCNTLYVGNLPLSTSEEELRSLFSRQPGYRRLCYRTKSNGPMCFVEFEDVGYAMKALGLLQGVCLSSSVKGGIRLSFSKNPLGVRSNANPNLVVNHYGVHHNGFSSPIHTHSGFAVPSSAWTGINQQLLGK